MAKNNYETLNGYIETIRAIEKMLANTRDLSLKIVDFLLKLALALSLLAVCFTLVAACFAFHPIVGIGVAFFVCVGLGYLLYQAIENDFFEPGINCRK